MRNTCLTISLTHNYVDASNLPDVLADAVRSLHEERLPIQPAPYPSNPHPHPHPHPHPQPKPKPNPKPNPNQVPLPDLNLSDVGCPHLLP